MSNSKKEEFEKGTERVQQLIDALPPSPPPTDTGRPENERGHTNFPDPEKSR